MKKQESITMKKQEHLPEIGVGPVYVVLIVIVTLIGILISVFRIIHVGNAAILKLPFIVFGIVLIIAGIIIFVRAQIDLGDHIRKNELVTTGIYAYVRNPIYTSFLMVCTGALFIVNDIWLCILPFIYWVFLTVLMIKTEEKWLHDLYGEQYDAYCRQVNRVIPWKNQKF